MSSGPEFERVEQPFHDQLVSMGWRFNTGSPNEPSVSGRTSFTEVLLKDDLKKALRRINLNDEGREWLDDGRLTQAVNSLERLGTGKLMEVNQKATGLLLKGSVVDGLPAWDQGRSRTVQYIDWDHPEKNIFRVINQFRVDTPGGHGRKYITPDLVLFVNGIPVVVVECKAPSVVEPLAVAINQLQSYANQRQWVTGDEGSEELFWYNQFVIGTCFNEARAGTFSSESVHFLEWKDTSPVPMAQVAADLRVRSLSSQQMLVAGMLRPEHLLDIIRNFTLFQTARGQMRKLVCRYQQFRAVQLAIQRMLTGETRKRDGEHDNRGGIIWHSQGTGKSLTMVYLILKMRTIPQLRSFKVVVVTDRKDLDEQLRGTAALTGEPLTIVKPEKRGYRTLSGLQILKETLARPGKDLVFAMIQKYREQRSTGLEVHEGNPDGDEEVGHEVVEPFPVLNEDESILVLVDEAHRSHTSSLHGNLLQALPNCARIGFSGTPILMGAKKRTAEIFGPFIDRYTIQQAQEDGAVVPIFYEGRTSEGAVAGGGRLDQVFEDLFSEQTTEEREAIQHRYATKAQVIAADKLIASKSRDMLRHYVENVLPNGFKAQVVAVDRRAAVRYQAAFVEARAELVRDLESVDDRLHRLSPEAKEKLEPEVRFLVDAHSHLSFLREMEFAAIVSGDHNDPPEWREWTDETKSESRRHRFSDKHLFHEDPEKRDPLAFLIVKSMLLTGFDAPFEQVLYLDRPIREAELLQAIARVNRTCGPNKKAGLVVDYYGVARHLREALEAYSSEDIEGALRSLQDVLPTLRDLHRRVMAMFHDRGLQDLSDDEACIEVLREDSVWAEFIVSLKEFLVTLDLVLPRPEGLPYVQDAKRLRQIQVLARNRYRRGETVFGKDVGEKVRQLIDEHIVALGIDPKIPPVDITEARFQQEVEKLASPRARASEMEHALRHHLRKHFDEDPTRYQKLSEKLESLLEELENRWEDLVEALKGLTVETLKGRGKDATGLDPLLEVPFFELLKAEAEKHGAVAESERRTLCDVTVEIVTHLRQELRLVDFWANPHAQDVLRKWVINRLDEHVTLFPFERQQEVADRVMGLAKANYPRLTR